LHREPVQVLWTGGWDSTYRLISLVLVYQRPVQPHYIITVNRPSFPAELRAMARIKAMLLDWAPEARERLRTTRITDVADLRADEKVAQQIRGLKAVRYVGSQYEYLGRYARQMAIPGLELCVEFSNHGGAYSFIKPVAVWTAEDGPFGYYEIAPDAADDNVALFYGFRFPLLDLSKLQMREQARRHGFAHLMDQTWFCHRPLPGDKPCGRCRPCGYAVTEGLARRLPWSSRMRHYLRRAHLSRGGASSRWRGRGVQRWRPFPFQ
jgi:hypothetical protein